MEQNIQSHKGNAMEKNSLSTNATGKSGEPYTQAGTKHPPHRTEVRPKLIEDLKAKVQNFNKTQKIPLSSSTVPKVLHFKQSLPLQTSDFQHSFSSPHLQSLNLQSQKGTGKLLYSWLRITQLWTDSTKDESRPFYCKNNLCWKKDDFIQQYLLNLCPCIRKVPTATFIKAKFFPKF